MFLACSGVICNVLSVYITSLSRSNLIMFYMSAEQIVTGKVFLLRIRLLAVLQCGQTKIHVYRNGVRKDILHIKPTTTIVSVFILCFYYGLNLQTLNEHLVHLSPNCKSVFTSAFAFVCCRLIV